MEGNLRGVSFQNCATDHDFRHPRIKLRSCVSEQLIAYD